MRVMQYKPRTVIFPDFEVCIILTGLIEAKTRKFGNRIPQPLAIYREGDILGFLEGDKGITAHVNTWSICKGLTEVIWMAR